MVRTWNGLSGSSFGSDGSSGERVLSISAVFEVNSTVLVPVSAPENQTSISLGDKRAVLANVPSFRFSFWGNMRTYPRSGFRSGGTSERTLIPVLVPGEHAPKPPLLETTLLGSSEHRAREPRNLTHELSHESAHENALRSVCSSQKRLHTSVFVFGISFQKNYISATRKYAFGN